jgi:hypothetical protein
MSCTIGIPATRARHERQPATHLATWPVPWIRLLPKASNFFHVGPPNGVQTIVTFRHLMDPVMPRSFEPTDVIARHVAHETQRVPTIQTDPRGSNATPVAHGTTLGPRPHTTARLPRQITLRGATTFVGWKHLRTLMVPIPLSDGTTQITSVSYPAVKIARRDKRYPWRPSTSPVTTPEDRHPRPGRPRKLNPREPWAIVIDTMLFTGGCPAPMAATPGRRSTYRANEPITIAVQEVSPVYRRFSIRLPHAFFQKGSFGNPRLLARGARATRTCPKHPHRKILVRVC